MTKGLFAIHTGKGKGKTTAALGLVFRALGHGHKVSVVQFIKGGWRCGEHKLAGKFPELLDLHVTGQGFTWKSEDLSKDTALAREAWQLAVEIIKKGDSRLVILDELTYLIRYNMVPEEEILTAIKSRPEGMHIVLTGRYASDNLIEAADLVTEMQEIKHPYTSGIPAQKGFDF
ncbi:cob(I)yrinic acid a,c-diamide adenosyltransferase [Desulfosediminicola flagellatus]|uniref:cob(I)yrinic acid a,c-diamide adenosyltransferase n=1 Tax=Desulfosediminicola flagellatus TaxID=2569541 RepID=UPI001E51E3A0|nr:cob(I)yrinic acid a,c-diamide adenosyltransferase [Desulfosediminicola flagellatus]